MINLFESSNGVIIGVIFAFILNLLVYWLTWRRIQPFSKPMAMITIILWSLSLAGWQVDQDVLLLILAQIFCLAGDIFLLFSKRWFIPGLAAFLVGHLFYLGLMGRILAEGLSSGAIASFSPFIILLGVICLALAMFVFFRVFRPSFKIKGSSQKLWLAVQLYALILSTLMIFSFVLVMVLPEFAWHRMIIPLGGALFFASDFMLAYDRFVNRNRLGQLMAWITYHLAQICLAWGLINLII